MILLVLALVGQLGPLESARQHIAAQRFDSAVPLLETYQGAQTEAPEVRELLLYALQARAKQLYSAGNLVGAMRDLNRAYQIDPANANVKRGLIAVYVGAGGRFLKEGDTEGAETSYREALKLDPTLDSLKQALASFRLIRGKVLEGDGRFLEALSQYRRALEIDTDNIEAHLSIGQLYYSREEFALASHHLKEARKLTTRAIVGLDALLAKVDREFAATRNHQTLEMDGFLVRFEGGHRPDLFYQVLPILREARERASRVLERGVRQPLTVIFYAGEGFKRAVDAPDWAAGLYDGKIRLREAELSQPPGYLARIIRHEVAHAVLEEVAPGAVPAWVHEGFAKYMEIDRWDPLQDAAYLLQAIRSKQQLSFDVLAAPFARLPTHADVRLAYAQSSAAIRYLGIMQGDRAISDLVSLLAAGRSIEKAVDSVTFYDLPTFQNRVNDWVTWEYTGK